MLIATDKLRSGIHTCTKTITYMLVEWLYQGSIPWLPIGCNNPKTISSYLGSNALLYKLLKIFGWCAWLLYIGSIPLTPIGLK